MTKIKLLQSYKSNVKGEIVEVSDQEATLLIQDGVARLLFNRDYLVKINSFGSQTETRAFDSSPNTK